MQIILQDAVLLYLKSLKPYTLAGFEPAIFCTVGGDDVHFTTPPENLRFNLGN
jgi:hypothetical protein